MSEMASLIISYVLSDVTVRSYVFVTFVIILITSSSSSASPSSVNKYNVVRNYGGNISCAFNTPDITIQVKSLLDCSQRCAQGLYSSLIGCVSFNYWTNSRTCQVYSITPTCVSPVTFCANYQVFDPIPPPTPVYTAPNDSHDCSDVPIGSPSGVYSLVIGGQNTLVYCDMITAGGGWTVFQRRIDDSVNFYRNFSWYQAGFGSPANDYWIGNDNLNVLTSGNNRLYELRVDLTDWMCNTRYAIYSNFTTANRTHNYTLTSLGSYSGNAGDSLTHHVGKPFSTYDVYFCSPSLNCAIIYDGAWWYGCDSETDYCHNSNLNGNYFIGGSHTSFANGMEWDSWTGYYYSMKITEMKIRPINF